ncbi:MAG: biopolymer transporter ExbD [Pirellulaceae bacterium]
MTSMIDIVFLLLIFFLATTTFIKSEKQLSAAINIESESAAVQAVDLEPAVVSLARIDGVVTYRFGILTTSDEMEIAKALKQFRLKTGGAFIKAGPGIPFEIVARLISLCKMAGFQQVTYVPEEV